MFGNISKKTVLTFAAALIALAALIFGIYKLNDFDKTELVSTLGRNFEKAEVTEIIKDNLAEDGNRYGEQEVMLYIKTGELKGQTVEATSPNGNLFGAPCKVGMPVIAIVSINGDTNICTVYSQDRTVQVICFVLIFVGCLWLVGGKKGLKSALCLGISLISIFYVFFPLVYRGFSPFAGAVAVAVVTTLVTLFTVGGINAKSVSAVIGTLFGVCAAGIAAKLFGLASGISGNNVSEIETLLYVAQSTKIQIGGLLFAGILISSLGAVMDVGMSISSTINEIHEKNPELSSFELFKSGINVGKDMMGTMSNTLILAFAGGSVITLIINYAYDLPFDQIINSYSIGIEIMQGIAGSLGIILTVPFTSLIAASLLKRKAPHADPQE